MAAFVTLSRQLLGTPAPPVVEPDDFVPPPFEIDERAAVREREHEAAMNALADAEGEARAAARTLRETAASLDAMRKVLLAEVRASTAAVILEAARRIAGDELHADPRLLQAIVEEAVRTLGRGGLVVRVCPQDGETLRQALQGGGIEVVEDFSIEGGCICEGPGGSIDASVTRAVAGVAAVLDQWK